MGESSLHWSMRSPRQNFKVEVDAKDTEDDLGNHYEAVGGDEDAQDNGNWECEHYRGYATTCLVCVQCGALHLGRWCPIQHPTMRQRMGIMEKEMNNVQNLMMVLFF